MRLDSFGKLALKASGMKLNQYKILVCYRSLRPGVLHPLTSVLTDLKYDVQQIDNGAKSFPSNSILLICGNANWFPNIISKLCNSTMAERPPLIIWQTEPLPPSKKSFLPKPKLNIREFARILCKDINATDVYTNWHRLKKLHLMGLPDLLIVSTYGRKDFLDEKQIKTYMIPIGYYPKEHGFAMKVAKDIDAVFLGTFQVPRRKRIIRKLQKRGINVFARGDWWNPEFWDENRTHLLNRTKIFLNIQRNHGELSGYRFLLGMANKALVISEPVYKPEPYIPGVHYISANIDEVPDMIRYYLNHESDRQEIVENAHQFITTELTLKNSVTQIMDLVNTNILKN
jgi:hypothetical protein